MDFVFHFFLPFHCLGDLGKTKNKNEKKRRKKCNELQSIVMTEYIFRPSHCIVKQIEK